jgi:hypothetical protein
MSAHRTVRPARPAGNTALPVLTIVRQPREEHDRPARPGEPVLQRMQTWVCRMAIARVSNPKPKDFDKPLDRALSDLDYIPVVRWARDRLSHSIVTNTPAGEAERQRWGAEVLTYPGSNRFLGVSVLLWDASHGVVRLLLALGSAGSDNTEDNQNAWHEHVRAFMLSAEFSTRPSDCSKDSERWKRWISAPDISRVTRDEEHSLRLFSPSQQIGVLWDFGGDILDSTGSDARDRWIDLVAQAAKERRRNLKRMHRGLASLARRGEWVSGVDTTPLGTGPAHGQTSGACMLVYQPETHPVLITLVRLGLQGSGTAQQLSMSDIATGLWEAHEYRSRDGKMQQGEGSRQGKPIHECSNGGAVVVANLYERRLLKAYRDGTYAWTLHNALKHDRHLGAGHEFEPEYPGDPYGVLSYPIPVPAPEGGWLRRHALNAKGELVDLPDDAPDTPLTDQRLIWDRLIELRSGAEPGEDTATNGGRTERSLGSGWMWFDTRDETSATTQFRTQTRSYNGRRAIVIAQRPASQSRHRRPDGSPGLLRGWYTATDDIRTFAWCTHAAWCTAYANAFEALIEALINDGITLDPAALAHTARDHDADAAALAPALRRQRATLDQDIEQLQERVEELEDRLAGRRANGKDTAATEVELEGERIKLESKQRALEALIVVTEVPAQRHEVDVTQLDPFAAFAAAVRLSANAAASSAVLSTANRLTPPGRASLSDDRTAITFTTTARVPHDGGFVERPFTFTVPNAYGASWRAANGHNRGNGPGDGLLQTAERLDLGLAAVLRDGQDISTAAATAHMQRNWTLARLQRRWDPDRVVSRGLRCMLFKAPVSTRQAVWHGHHGTAAPAHLDPRMVQAETAIYRSKKAWSFRHWAEGSLLHDRAAALAVALSLPDPEAGVPAKALARMLGTGRFTVNNISIRRRGQLTGLPSMQRVLRQEDGTLKTEGADPWRGGQFAELYGAQRVRPIACPWTDCRSPWATLLLAAPDTVLMGTGLGPGGTDLDHGTLVICRECHRGPKNPARYPDDVVASALDPLAAAPGIWRACAWRSCRRDDGFGPGKLWVFDSARVPGGRYFHDDLCRRHEHLPPDYDTVQCAAPDCTQTFTRARLRRGILKVFHNAECRSRTEAGRRAAEKVKVVIVNCRYAGCTVDAGHGPGKVAQVYDGGSGGRSTYHGSQCRKAEQRRQRGLPPLEAPWTKCGYDQCSRAEAGGEPGHFVTGDGRRAFHDNNCRRKALTAQRRGVNNGFVTCGWAACEQDDGNGVGSLRLPDEGSSRNRRFHPQCQAGRRRGR